MRRLNVAFPILTAMILAGCDTGDYFPDDESAGIDSGRQDSVSLPDVATQPDPGNTSNELRLYKSGSRIKAKVLKTADGSQAFMGWYDTELETDCYAYDYYRAEDGKIRYLPTDRVQVDPNNNYYADGACKQRIYLTSLKKDCVTAAKWTAVMTPATSCNSQWHLAFFQDNQKYSGSSVYERDSDNVCKLASDYLNSYFFLSSLGHKVDPSIFAEATPAIVD